MNFFFRNPKYCIKNPRTAWATVKAMREHRKANPSCAWCGKNKGLHVHHKVSIWADPELADDHQNFLTLCGRNCHLTIGHAGDWKQYVKNPDDICESVNIVKQKKE